MLPNGTTNYEIERKSYKASRVSDCSGGTGHWCSSFLLSRWTCSPMAWCCMSYWLERGLCWGTTNSRLLKSSPKVSGHCWAAQRKYSSAVSRPYWPNAGTPSRRRWAHFPHICISHSIMLLKHLTFAAFLHKYELKCPFSPSCGHRLQTTMIVVFVNSVWTQIP